MALKRVQAEQELISRAKKKMQLVEMDVTSSGSNPDLDSPLATALRKMGLSVSGVVDDNDLQALSDDDVEEFLDRAELRLRENIRGNFDLANTKIGNRWEDFKDVVAQLDSEIQNLRQQVANNYGDGGSSLTGGYIALDFAEKGDDEIDA
jgi:hypothetical protein